MRSLFAQFLAAAFLFGGISVAHAQSSDSVLYTRDTLKNANGEAIFHNICQGCHMPDAKGATGAGTYPALANNPKLAEAGYPVSVIIHGQKAMPPLGGMLSDKQIADVVTYIRTHFGNHYTEAVNVADVKTAR
jgi:mono/diheme cytochrome c family protein